MQIQFFINLVAHEFNSISGDCDEEIGDCNKRVTKFRDQGLGQKFIDRKKIMYKKFIV